MRAEQYRLAQMIPPNARASLLELAHVWQHLVDEQGRATNVQQQQAHCPRPSALGRRASTLGEIGHRLGRKILAEVANVARPDTILAWSPRRFEGAVSFTLTAAYQWAGRLGLLNAGGMGKSGR
jgi:hypothetical protein